jgi:predicted SAM-dependent methyltransferase
MKPMSQFQNIVKQKLPFAVPAARAIKSIVKQRNSLRVIRRLLTQSNEISIEVGAGDKKGQNGWTTIDMTKNCDIFWDLRKGLPFPNGSVNRIYSSHFFEHLSFQETRNFLGECKRVLPLGGKFLICVPNARIYLEAYVKNIRLDSAYFGYKPAYNNTTQIDYANYTAYMNGEHKYMFDEENLLHILQSNGFRNVHLRKFDPSLDLVDRDFESIYAEAEK